MGLNIDEKYSTNLDHFSFVRTEETLPFIFRIEKGYKRTYCVQTKDGEICAIWGVSNIKAEPQRNYKRQKDEEIMPLVGIVINAKKDAKQLSEFFKEIAEKMEG